MNNLAEILIAVLNSLWQAALLTGLVWLVLRFSPRMNAATRFAIWWAVLGVVLILPGAPRMIGAARQWAEPATSQVSHPRYEPTPTATPVIALSPLVTVEHRSAPHWPAYVVAIWVLTLVYRLAQLVLSYVHVRGVKRRASVSSESLPGTRRPATLLVSNEIDSPIAVGFLRPAVIVSDSLLAKLSREEMDHVLLHETAHLARWDDWTTLLARFFEAAFALHPVAMWIWGRIEIERERACDEWVVTRTQSVKAYARSLARLYELRLTDQQAMRLASGIFSNQSRLGQRIEALLSLGREFTARVSAVRVVASCAALIALTTMTSLMPSWIAFAQAPRPAFEVASIKRNTEGNDVNFEARPGGRLSVFNNGIDNLIINAYGIARYQLIGLPDWYRSERYDIEAKGAETAGQKDVMLMLQTLLADRFAMKSHFEEREMSAYILTVAKGGSKLHILGSENCVPLDTTKQDARAVPNVCGNSIVGGSREKLVWRANHISMPNVLRTLSGNLRGPVIDQTGIQGTFDISLEWSNDLAPPANPDAPPPSLSTALHETLGLELKPGRGPGSVLVVEHIERPSSN